MKHEKTELEKRLEAELKKTASNDAGHSSAASEGEESLSEDESANEEETVELEQINVEQLVHEREALVAECEELKDQLLRARAEFDNYRKRMAREAERARKMAADGLVRSLLPVLDHLELALEHAKDNSGGLAEGVAIVVKQFQEVLAANGVEPIPAKGVVFDPTVHEAVMQRPSDETPAGHVVMEFQKGYTLNGVVLRPSKVVVSSGSAEQEYDQDEQEEEREEETSGAGEE
jgi:molecular chaperone GrpE